MVGEKYYWTAKAWIQRTAMDGTPKSYWHRIGSGKELKDSDKIELVLDSIPLNWDGKMTLFLVNPDTEDT